MSSISDLGKLVVIESKIRHHHQVIWCFIYIFFLFW